VSEIEWGVPEALRKEPTAEDPARTAEVMALVGFAGPAGERVRLYSDVNYQRWLDVPQDQIVASKPLAEFNPGRPTRTILWVNSEWMFEEVFNETAAATLNGELVDPGGMSTGQLIPGSRFLAAQLLDLVPHLAYDKKDTL
jgi:hypothetical protein